MQCDYYLIERENLLPPNWGSNPTVQPVASHYTIHAIPPASHTEDDGMSMAYSRGKIINILLHKDLCDTNSNFAF
jgi:hypothetical protein